MEDDRDQLESTRWRSAQQLSRDFIAGSATTNRRLMELRFALTTDISEQAGIPWEEAANLVEQHLIRRRGKTAKPGPKAIQATEDAVRMLGLVSRAETPLTTERWLSPNQLKDHYMGGSTRIATKLRAAADSLIVDITEQTPFTENEARVIIDHHFLRHRLPHESGTTGLYAAPRLVELLEREGMLRRRREQGPLSTGSDNAPPARGGRNRG